MSGLVWVQVNESGGLRCWSSFRRACVALYYILHVADTAPAAAVRREILPIPKSVALHCIVSPSQLEGITDFIGMSMHAYMQTDGRGRV